MKQSRAKDLDVDDHACLLSSNSVPSRRLLLLSACLLLYNGIPEKVESEARLGIITGHYDVTFTRGQNNEVEQ